MTDYKLITSNEEPPKVESDQIAQGLQEHGAQFE